MKFLRVRQFRLSIPGEEIPPAPRNPSDAPASQGLTEATSNRRFCDSACCGAAKVTSTVAQTAAVDRMGTCITVPQGNELCHYEPLCLTQMNVLRVVSFAGDPSRSESLGQ